MKYVIPITYANRTAQSQDSRRPIRPCPNPTSADVPLHHSGKDDGEHAQEPVPEVLTAITSWKAEEATREQKEKEAGRARVARLAQSKEAVLEVIGFYKSDLEGTRDYNPEVPLLVLEIAEKVGIKFTKQETERHRG